MNVSCCPTVRWCESPPIQKRVSSCSDGCCTTTTTSIANGSEVAQFVNDHSNCCGSPAHNLCDTMNDISRGGNMCCTPNPNIQQQGYTPLKYAELNCPTVANTCCTPNNVLHNAMNVRGNSSSSVAYGEVCEVIKEVPTANIYIVNHVFVDLMIDSILGCLPIMNLSQSTVHKIEQYVKNYYMYHEDLSKVGELNTSSQLDIEQSLVVNEYTIRKTKAVLTALDKQLKGDTYVYCQ